MTPKDLDRINALMRLALNNPSEQESLRAALMAVKMIEKHKALRTADANYRPHPGPQQDFHSGQRGGKTQTTPNPQPPDADWIRDIFRQYEQSQKSSGFWDRESAPYTAEREPVREPKSPKPSRSDEEKQKAKEAADKAWNYYEQEKAQRGKTTYPPYDKDGNPSTGSATIHGPHMFHRDNFRCSRCGADKYAVLNHAAPQTCPL